MTPEAADWVYSNVLPAWYLGAVGADNDGRAAVRGCRCHWGRCGWCSINRPERCAHRLGTAPKPTYDTFISSRGRGAVAEVRRPGKPCVWRCPGPPAEVDVQLELFAVGSAHA